jgi:hypothetical protein
VDVPALQAGSKLNICKEQFIYQTVRECDSLISFRKKMLEKMLDKANPYPSVFTMAAVFGGCAGMTISNLFGYEGGGGFLLGSVIVFLIVGTAVLIARHREKLFHDTVVLSTLAAAAGLNISEYAAFAKRRHSHAFRNVVDDAVWNAFMDAVRTLDTDEDIQLPEEQRRRLRRKLKSILEQSKRDEGGGHDWQSSSETSS